MMSRNPRRKLSDGYAIRIRPLSEEEGGGWLAEVPDLPGCMTDGETPEEALAELEEAVHAWMDAQIARGRPIPPPSKPEPVEYSGRLTLRMPKSLHRRLARKAEQEGVSLNQYLLSLISENHVRSTVKHTVEIIETHSHPLIATGASRYQLLMSLSPQDLTSSLEGALGRRKLFTQHLLSTVEEDVW